MYNRRHCYSHKSIDSAWQNLRRAIPSNPLKPPWSLILWSICFVLCSPMILLFFNFVHYSSCLKYIFQGEKGRRGCRGGERCCRAPGSNWHSRWHKKQPRLPLTLSFRLTYHVAMTFGRLIFLLSVVGGHSPKVKCREDSFVFKGEASLLFNLLLCL